MDDWQKSICAIALFADGYSKYQISEALGVDSDQAQRLIDAGAAAQRHGEMGYMKQHRAPWVRDPVNGPKYTD